MKQNLIITGLILTAVTLGCSGNFKDPTTAGDGSQNMLYPFSIKAGPYSKKYGLIDACGKWVVKPTYDFIYPFSEGIARAEGNGKVYFLNLQGKVKFEGNYFGAKCFSDGLAAVQKKQDSGWDYIDKTGKIVIEGNYAHARKFKNGYARVAVNENDKLKVGLINKNGEFILKPAYEHSFLISPFSEGLVAMRENNFWGYVNLKGEWVIKPNYKIANPFIDGVAVVSSYGASRVIDKSGKTILDSEYRLDRITKNIYAYCDGRKFGLIRLDGTKITEPIFSRINSKLENGLIAASDGKKYGYINIDGQWEIKPSFDFADQFRFGRAMVKNDNNWSCINTKGNTIK